jgi:hypothetical protein
MNLGILALALLAGPAPSPSPSPVPAGDVLIVNSGSTNRAGYRIAVAPDGRVQVMQGTATRTLTIPAQLAAQLYADLAAAGPLDAMPAQRCMKSASFGSTTTIAYAAKTSPDLQCEATSAAAHALAADVAAVTAAAGVRVMRRTLPIFRGSAQ